MGKIFILVGYILILVGCSPPQKALPLVERPISPPEMPILPDIPPQPKSIPANMNGFNTEILTYTGVEIGMPFEKAVGLATQHLKPLETASEGMFKFSEQKFISSNSDQLIVLLTGENMADDSVRSMQLKLISDENDDHPTVRQFGWRLKCWRGEPPNEWVQ